MQSFHRLLAPALSFNGGYVDTVGFLALQGLFTAHVTGNFVTLGVSIVHGASGAFGKIIALPLFALVVGLTHLSASSLQQKGIPPLRPLLAAHTLLLALFCVLAISLGPFRDGDSPLAILTGMTAVSAMAIQNTVSRLHMKGMPPTTLMTGNVTQIAVDFFELISQAGVEKRGVIKNRMKPTGKNLLGFAAGCTGGALLYRGVGLGCLIVPVFVAVWAWVTTEK